jgi:hypothetical protein
MKITRPFFLLLAICFATQPMRAQVSNADTMIHKLFATLKAKDQNAFISLYPDANQFGRFIRNIMEQTMKSDEIKKMMEMDPKTKGINLDSLVDVETANATKPEAMAALSKEFSRQFQQIIAKGEKKGVKWNEAVLTSYTIDSSAAQEGVPFVPKGFKEAKGVIDFKVGNEAYQLAYGKVMFLESEGGWFGAEFPQLARKGESLDPDPRVGADDDEAASQPKKPAAKSKAPAPKKKAPAKAPARKKS